MEKILLEYVSANPNTTINLLHAREGVVGDVLANLLAHQGHHVTREFYINDYLKKETKETSDNSNEQRQTLERLRIRFDHYASEHALYSEGHVEKLLATLQEAGHTREQGGALWLKTTTLGDTQDRVLVRAGGEPTYYLSDLAYHRDKFQRGYDRLIDIWDANHAEYVTRTRAGLALLGLPVERLKVLHVAPIRILAPGTGRAPDAPLAAAEVLGGVSPEALRLALLRTPASEPLETTLDAMIQGYLPLQRAYERIQSTTEFSHASSPIADAFVVQWGRAVHPLTCSPSMACFLQKK
jgi:hypothetical protein